MDALIAFLNARLDEDEEMAREASGGTVIGEPGNWDTAPTGDEWEASLSDEGDLELLVALRTELPRPPDVMSGYWGAVIAYVPDEHEPDVAPPIADLRHAARHDPARVLREVAAKRSAVEEYQAVLEDVDSRDGREFDDAGYGRAMVSSLRGVLKAMADVYSDHPEYQKEWTP